MILLIMFAALAWASLTVKPENSSFPIADLLISATVMRNSQDNKEGKKQASEILFDEIFTDIEPGKSSGILNRANGVPVNLKTGQTPARGPLKSQNGSTWVK